MIYFIQGEITKLIKIGQTNRLQQRLSALQCGSPDRLQVLGVVVDKIQLDQIWDGYKWVLGDGYLDTNDKEYHLYFGEDRVHGEWFSSSLKLLNFIQNKTLSLDAYRKLCKPDIITRRCRPSFPSKFAGTSSCRCGRVKRTYQQLCITCWGKKILKP